MKCSNCGENDGTEKMLKYVPDLICLQCSEYIKKVINPQAMIDLAAKIKKPGMSTYRMKYTFPEKPESPDMTWKGYFYKPSEPRFASDEAIKKIAELAKLSEKPQ